MAIEGSLPMCSFLNANWNKKLVERIYGRSRTQERSQRKKSGIGWNW